MRFVADRGWKDLLQEARRSSKVIDNALSKRKSVYAGVRQISRNHRKNEGCPPSGYPMDALAGAVVVGWLTRWLLA